MSVTVWFTPWTPLVYYSSLRIGLCFFGGLCYRVLCLFENVKQKTTKPAKHTKRRSKHRERKRKRERETMCEKEVGERAKKKKKGKGEYAKKREREKTKQKKKQTNKTSPGVLPPSTTNGASDVVWDPEAQLVYAGFGGGLAVYSFNSTEFEFMYVISSTIPGSDGIWLLAPYVFVAAGSRSFFFVSFFFCVFFLIYDFSLFFSLFYLVLSFFLVSFLSRSLFLLSLSSLSFFSFFSLFLLSLSSLIV